VVPAGGGLHDEYPKGLLGRLAILAKGRASRDRDNCSGWFEAGLPPRTAARKSAMRSIADQKMMEEFDEEWYLATYADVAAAVRGGRLWSGFRHFQHHGRAEGLLPARRNTADDALRGAAGSLPGCDWRYFEGGSIIVQIARECFGRR
jgi:hypothetical protein